MQLTERRCAAAQISDKRPGFATYPRCNLRAKYIAFTSQAPTTKLATSKAAFAARKEFSSGRTGSRIPCACDRRPVTTEDDVVRYASVGDIVNIQFTMRDEDGQVIQSSADLGAPLCFEVGAGDVLGNRLFMGLDEAVRGMAVGQTTVLEASGGEWKRDYLFAVPRDHQEVQRLEGRYKNQGGLTPGLVVELSNGAMAVILEVTDSEVKLDANNMLAGKTFTIEMELLAIESASATGEAAATAPSK